MLKHLNPLLFLFSTVLLPAASGQEFFDPNPAVSIQPEKINSFLAGIPEIAKKAEYYNLSEPVLQTILVVQSNCGKSVADGQFNYARVVPNKRLQRFEAFANSKNGFVVCDKRSRGVELASLCLNFIRSNGKATLSDANWLTLVFGPGGDLNRLAAEAEGVYRALTGKGFYDLKLDFGTLGGAAVQTVKVIEEAKQPEKTQPAKPKAELQPKSGDAELAALRAENGRLKGENEELRREKEELVSRSQRENAEHEALRREHEQLKEETLRQPVQPKQKPQKSATAEAEKAQQFKESRIAPSGDSPVTLLGNSVPATKKGSWMIGTAAGLGNRNYNALSSLGDSGGEFTNAQNNGISFSAYTDDEEEEKVSNFNFAPNIGHFISDGLMLGLSVNYSSTAGKDVGYKNKYSALTLGPLVRYYYDLGLIKFTFEGSLGFGTLKNKYKYDGDIEIYKESLFSLSAGPGVSILLNDHISIEAQGLYDRFSVKDEDGDEVSQGKFGLRIGFGLFL